MNESGQEPQTLEEWRNACHVVTVKYGGLLVRIAKLEAALQDVVETIECVVGDSTQCGDCPVCRARELLTTQVEKP